MSTLHIAAFGASTSLHSINQEFAQYTAQQINNSKIDLLKINDFHVPMYSIDLEMSDGIPHEADTFAKRVAAADLIIISLAEHNGSYTAAFKNLFDWCSRRAKPLFEHKDMILLSTSPGRHGASMVLEAAIANFPLHGANIIAHFSLPNYYESFDSETGILKPELKKSYYNMLSKINSFLHEKINKHLL